MTKNGVIVDLDQSDLTSDPGNHVVDSPRQTTELTMSEVLQTLSRDSG